MRTEEAKAAVSELGRRMLDDGLTKGTGGNISVKTEDGTVAISPSGMAYDDIGVDDVPVVDIDGEQVAGEKKPSSEFRMHTDVLRERDDVGAIVHNHSPYASTFASIDEPVEASHYLIAFIGDEIPVASYETYGTAELAEVALETLGEEYNACLLENHGVLATGATAEKAYEVALMVEYCARIHYQARSIGEPELLSDGEIDTLLERFANYGQVEEGDERASVSASGDVSEDRLQAIRPQREAVADHGRKMLHQGLTEGTGGNISTQDGDLVAISPSGMPYDDIDPEDVAVVDLAGDHVAGEKKPSSEVRMHTGILRERDDVGAVVHNHSPYASTFASLGRPVDASHYLIAFAGDQIPVAGYATYGTQALADLALETLGEEYNACLLQNHGVVATGETVAEAFEVALMVEYCARIHYQALNIGEPSLLADAEIDTLLDRFAHYGQQH
ncbi:class II aldolase/adducin family protein [Haloarcula onubensis]|uniref:Class II aldolase/adducin family protein n=1 Tax=Haloarcula onubensis TaxID=2950539 RepID=A0ABU2FJ23_9EURY|nr:class II aldolase/adducin family protein [Halomicroarcula sp. S3CR25-11]MDS0280748.1 class II aldolase/adducin family protein [Halomicroarcula sp. S3CR25-11]